MTYEKIVEYVQKKAAKVKANVDAAVQVDITGEGEGAFYVQAKDGKYEVEPYEYYGHDAKIVADGKDFIAFLDGKKDESVITVEGDADKAVIVKALASKAAEKKEEKKAEPAKAEAPKAEKAAPAKKEETAKKAPAKKAAAKK